jgi:hypothetical protein
METTWERFSPHLAQLLSVLPFIFLGIGKSNPVRTAHNAVALLSVPEGAEKTSRRIGK